MFLSGILTFLVDTWRLCTAYRAVLRLSGASGATFFFGKLVALTGVASNDPLESICHTSTCLSFLSGLRTQQQAKS